MIEKIKMSNFRDCNNCEHEPGDCLFCSDVTKNMFKLKRENGEDMIERNDNEYELICDHCELSKTGFYTFDEAVRYKKIKKWKSVKTKTQGWVDLCPKCATPENITEYRNK